MFLNPAWPYLRLTDDDQYIVGIDEAVQVAIGDAIVYLLRDEFTTAQSAPLTTPRACEPGPGTLAILDTGNLLTVASGALTNSTAAGTGVADPRIGDATGWARVAGRALIIKWTQGSIASCRIGWATSTGDTLQSGLLTSSVGAAALTMAGSQCFLTEVTAASNVMVAVLRASGAFIFLNGVLAWHDTRINTTPMLAGVFAGVAGANRFPSTIDYIRIIDLGAPFNGDYALATLHQTSGLTSGTNFTGDADGIHDLTFTGPGSPALNDKIELRFNVTDANNYNTAYLIRTAVPDWTFNMDTVLAGTPTNRISVTGIVTLPTAIRVIGNGSLRDCYTLSGTTWTKRGSQSNVSNQNTSTLTNVTFTAGQFTPSVLDSFPRSSSAYSALTPL
jgi:hypothetical protein